MSAIEITVEEYTTPNPLSADENTPLPDLIRIMRENSIRHIPIVRQDRVVGIVSERDTRVASGLTSSEKTLVRARDIMAADPVTVNAAARLDEVALEMSERKIGCVIVNDENDQLLGLFTSTDALNALIEVARAASRE